MKKNSQLMSKYRRIRMADDLRQFIGSIGRILPIRGLRESQIGNYVYRGDGEIRTGTSYVPFQLRIRIVRGEMTVLLNASRAGLSIWCPFDREGEAVVRAVQKALN